MARYQWSLFSRLLWLPVLAAPLRYVFPRMILPAIVVGAAWAAVKGGSAGIGLGLGVWFVAGWIVTFTYRGDEKGN